MKIAHIVCSYPPYYSGMGTVVSQTASELIKQGHQVEVFTPLFEERLPRREEEYTPDMQENIAYAKYLKPSIQYGNAARISKLKKELNAFDIVHLHYPFYGTANIVRRWKLQNPKKPLVITYHMDTRGPGWKGLVFKWYAKFWMPKILNSADKIIASSFDYIAASNARELFKANPKKWIEIPFGVDIERFQPREKTEELFVQWNLDSTLPTIIFVGGMDEAHYFKGIPVLLKALLLLKERGLDLQAVFVGEGTLKEEFRLRALGYRLQKVRFVGKVDYVSLPSYYNMADILVLPSIHQGEAFGMVLLEAMASGVPVVASDLPGVRTVARDGGLMFTPNQAEELAQEMMSFFSDQTDRQEWQIRVRHVVEEKYAWGPLVERLERVYTELVAS